MSSAKPLVRTQASDARGAPVVIIGAGVTGLSTGWWLARQGHEVLVIEKGLVGWEASGRNGGGCSHHFSPLFAEEQRLWPQMDDLLGYPTEFQHSRLRLAFDASQMVLHRRAMDNAARYGFLTDVLDADTARRLVPWAGDKVHGGYHYHFGGHANPHRSLQAYAWALQDLGGRILQHAPVIGFDRQAGRITAVKTSRGDFGADHVVIAAGPGTRRLGAMLDVDLPLIPARAEMIITEPLPLMPITAVDGNGLYGRQTLRGNLAYGGGPHEWLDEFEGGEPPSKSTTPLVRSIAKRLAELFPKVQHARVIRSWSGFIENTPDGRPVLDMLPGCENAVVATMSGIGFGLSPAVGRVVAQLVTQGCCDFADISTLRMSRFETLEPDWQEIQGWVSRTASAA
jgi:sarcosine oxidase subunit beta